MGQVTASKIRATSFAAAATTETYNIHEVATLLRTTAAGVKAGVKAGTVPAPLYAGRGEMRWTKAMLTAGGITAAKP